MKNYFYLFILTLITASCDKQNDVQTIKINDYSLEIPSNLSESKDLNDVASLQYQNPFDEFYVIVIDEKKKDLESFFAPNSAQPNSLDGYSELLKINMASIIGKIDFSKIKTEQINGMKAKKFSVETKIENLDAYYEFGFFESKTSYYQVMLWTLLEKKEEHAPKMQKVINSFKELKSRAKTKS